MTHPGGTERQLERSRSRTSPQDEPSQSFLCRSSLVAFPSLPDEKEFLQPEGGSNFDEISHHGGSLLHDIPHNLLVTQMVPLSRAVGLVQAMSGIKLSQTTCLGSVLIKLKPEPR